MYESIRALDSRCSIICNLASPSNTILSYFFLFFLIIDLYFLFPTVIAQIFNPTTELAIPIGIQLMDQRQKLKHNY